jgi:hypothetical protein
VVFVKVKIFNKQQVHFLWVFGIVIALSIGGVWTILTYTTWNYMGVFFGSFSLFLLIILAYYWMNSRGYWDNLGRIRRTFYAMFLVLMAIGFISGHIDYKDWQLLTQLAALSVFVDLAVFQTPNILKIWSAEFKHEDEVREALQESKKTILKNAKKVEKFSQVIQYTDFYFTAIPIPSSEGEYQQQLEEYLKQYGSTFGFAISSFLFPVPTSEDEQKNYLKAQVGNIGIRHAKQFTDEEKEKLLGKFSTGETYPITEDKLIAIPYFGSFYSMIVTLEAKDVAVDVIDASHISNLLYIFDWYMADASPAEEDDETEK